MIIKVKMEYVGFYSSLIEAAKAFDKRAIELGFDTMKLNFTTKGT